jgi:hypothetical protein
MGAGRWGQCLESGAILGMARAEYAGAKSRKSAGPG